MILILMCLVSRAVFLGVVFVPDGDTFAYNMLTCNIPSIFKLLTIVSVCKYKINTYYVAICKKARARVRWSLLALQFIIIGVQAAIIVCYCTSIKDATWLLVETVPQMIIDAFLIFFSLALTLILGRELSFGVLTERKKWLYLMEAFI